MRLDYVVCTREISFIDSIVPGLQGISTLFEPGKLEGEYPEIQYAIRVAFEKYFVPLHPESKE